MNALFRLDAIFFNHWSAVLNQLPFALGVDTLPLPHA